LVVDAEGFSYYVILINPNSTSNIACIGGTDAECGSNSTIYPTLQAAVESLSTGGTIQIIQS
jgi:hypothetical protein